MTTEVSSISSGSAATVPKNSLIYSEDNLNDDDVDEKIENYDAVLFTVCDMYGRARGRFATARGIKRAVEQGMETPYNICMLGLHLETPTTLDNYKKTTGVTSHMIPDLSTLRPLSWLCKEDRKVGHVLCDLYTASGERDPNSPREVALRQLESLKNLGYQIMTAFETEYQIYYKGTLNEYSSPTPDMMNAYQMDMETQFLYDHVLGLQASGIPLEAHMEEYAPGQIELSYKPQFGIKMADIIHRLRYLSKSLCAMNGLEATFMTRIKEKYNSNGAHCNHSVWTLDGKNAFYDETDEHKCSAVLRHWLAGLIHHGRALTAFLCPTINCYERLFGFFAPSDNNWNYDDKNARVRVKTKGTNIHIEERTPSAATNPYLTLAALIAAGVDGIKRQLELPPPRVFRPLLSMMNDERTKVINPLPKSLSEALQSLQEDTVLTQALGETFVQDYVSLSKEFQLEKLKDALDKEASERFAAERDLYFQTL